MKYKEVKEGLDGCEGCVNMNAGTFLMPCKEFISKNNLRNCWVSNIIFVEDKEASTRKDLEKNVREAKELLEKALRELEDSKKLLIIANINKIVDNFEINGWYTNQKDSFLIGLSDK
jgi:hypothetical protein